MLLRGATRRCPWCGGRGAFFIGWFKKSEHCQTCGLCWRRDDVGYELGAAAITAIITFGPLMLVLGAMVAVTWPEVNAGPMFAVLVVMALGLPLLTYSLSYTIWQSIDILMRPPTPDDFEIVADVDADADVEAPGATGVAGSDDT
jgi:uncharacterized protein (DUF983 family)